jgi:hypothetical protein
MRTSKGKTFAMFILTHGRPNEQYSLEELKKSGYTGDVYLIIDNEDATADEYFKRYGDKVIQFDKAKAGELFDIADTRKDRRATVFARNQCFNIAKELGLDYHMQLDDDYRALLYRYPEGNMLGSHAIKSMNQVIEAMIDLMEDTGATSVAMAQGGDFIGGLNNPTIKKGLLRKCMNTWLLKTDQPLEFVGRMNDDVNTYVVNGARGHLFFTSTVLQTTVMQTQKTAGGMTEMYLDSGTYMKSMYTVMMQPSSVTVRPMGSVHKRLHHSVNWNCTVPKIISGVHKKH